MRLFDEASLHKLEQLTLQADSVRVGAMKGNRRSRKRGTSIEFADYREYSQGDDLRRLDWNVYARLERPFLKLTEEEEDLAVHILVDVSGSMDWPILEGEEDKPFNKLRYGLTLAGATGYLGLLSGDVVFVTLFDDTYRQSWGPFRGRQNGWPLLQFLEANYESLANRPPSERKQSTSINTPLRDYALRGRRPGLLFFLSDLLAADGYREGLSALGSRGHEIVLLHLHSPDEISPQLSGDLRLVDVETGESAEVSLDALTIEAYSDRLAAWHAEIGAFCANRTIHYIPINTNTPWDVIVMQGLRRQGIIR